MEVFSHGLEAREAGLESERRYYSGVVDIKILLLSAAPRVVARPRPGAARRATIWLPALIAAALMSPGPGNAQRFGQWWWEGAVGIGQRSTDNSLADDRVSEFDQQELRLSLGLNGFVLHPAVGSFRLGLDLLVSEFDGGRELDTDRIGLSGDLKLFSRGSYPLELYARSQSFDYTGPAVEEPFGLLRIPDTSDHLGGRLRIRQGALRGTLVGVDHSSFDFVDAAARPETRDQEFIDWSRTLGRFQNHVRLEHTLRDFGSVGFEIEDLTANFDQRGDLTPSWRWELSGLGIFRDLTVGDGSKQRTDDFRIRNRLLHTIRDRDLLDLHTSFGVVRPAALPSIDTHGLSLFYRWRPWPGWEVAPFGQYAEQSSANSTSGSQRVGLAATWNREKGAVDTALTARTSHGRLELDDSDGVRDESQTAYAVTGSFGQGEVKKLRREFEFEVAHNELRLTQDPIFELPDLGAARSGLGAEDLRRARVSLSHRHDSRSFSGWGEWNMRESSRRNGAGDFEAETLSSTLQHNGPNYTLQANLGETVFQRFSLTEEKVRYLGAAANWRPRRYLQLRASYRTDDRELELVPDVDGERLQLGLTVRFGLLALEATAFETKESIAGGAQRQNRGFSWSLSRNMAGWLPIVTGTQRRGVIR